MAQIIKPIITDETGQAIVDAHKEFNETLKGLSSLSYAIQAETARDEAIVAQGLAETAQANAETARDEARTLAEGVASLTEIGVDTTLSISGAAADAQVTGQLSRQLSEVSISQITGLVTGTQKLDKSLLQPGFYNYATGIYITSDSYSHSEFIKCLGETTLWVNFVSHITFWDENFNYISGDVNASNAWASYTIPNTAYYVNLSVQNSYVNYAIANFGANHSDEKKYTADFKDKFITNLKGYRWDIDVTWEEGGLNGSGEKVSVSSMDRTDYFTVPSNIKEFTISCENYKLWICAYDENHNKVYAPSAFFNSLTINNAYKYYIVVIDNVSGGHHFEYVNQVNLYFNLTDNSTYKQPYQAGFIGFTVPVNQKTVDVSSTADVQTDNENDMVNVDCIVKLPTTYTPNGKPSRLLMICHGAGRGVTGEGNWTTITGYNNIVNAFLSHGYVVFDCNGYDNTYYGHDFWGAPRGVEAWRKAYEYVVKNYNVEQNLSIYAFSMGGMTAMNLALNNFPNIKVIALASPVLDLYKCWTGTNTLTKAAYNMNTYDPDVVAGNNPIGNIVTINGTDRFMKQLPPIKVWFGGLEDGSGSVYVNKADGQAVVQAIKNANGTAWYREVDNAGHEICYGENNDCINEYICWINRFTYQE